MEMAFYPQVFLPNAERHEVFPRLMFSTRIPMYLLRCLTMSV